MWIVEHARNDGGVLNVTQALDIACFGDSKWTQEIGKMIKPLVEVGTESESGQKKYNDHQVLEAIHQWVIFQFQVLRVYHDCPYKRYQHARRHTGQVNRLFRSASS